MTTHEFTGTPSLVELPQELPGPFRIGEIIINRLALDEPGNERLDSNGNPPEKRIITDLYDGLHDPYTPDAFASMSFEFDDTTGLTLTSYGGTGYVQESKSLGIILPAEAVEVALLQLYFGVSDREALDNSSPHTLQYFNRTLKAFREEVIADKIAHGEPVTAAERSVNDARLARKAAIKLGKIPMNHFLHHPEQY